MKSYLPFQLNREEAESSIWNLPSGALKRLGRGYVTDITLSPKGDHLVVTTPLGLWWYNISTCEPLTLIGWIPGPIAFSNDGKWVATTSERGSIEVWDMNNEGCLMELARAENESINELVFSPDRQYIAVGGICRRSNREKRIYCSVEVWSIPEKAKTAAVPLHIERDRIYAGAHPLAFSPDSRLLAFAVPEDDPQPYRADGYPVVNNKWFLPRCFIAVCEIATGMHLTTLDILNDLNTISFSPCGQFLAAADCKGTIYVWKIPENFSLDTSPWHLHKVYEERDDEQDFHLVSYSLEGTLRTARRSLDEGIITVQEPERSETLYKHSKDNIHYRAYFSKGTSLAFAGSPDVHVWTSGDKHSICVSQMHGFPPHSLHFSSNGLKLLATQREDGVFSWDVRRPDQQPCVFKPISKNSGADVSDTYFSVALSSEGKQFVTSGSENNLYLWELGIDTPIAAFPIQEKVINATFSPTANLIACRDVANQIYIWDITIGELRDTYMSDGEIGLWDAGLTYSLNGAYLASGRCHLYDVVQREQINGYINDYFQFMAFSSDSAHFWDTGSPDTIELWNIQRGEEVLALQKPEGWNQKEVHTLLPAACGRYLACSPVMYESDISVSLGIWDIYKSTTPIATFEVPCPYAGDTLALAFSPDNTLLASSGDDGTILLWDMKPYLRNT